MAKIYKIVGIKDAKIGYLDASDEIAYEDVPFANRATMASNTTEITFEGDNTSEKVFSDNELSGTLGHDKMSIDLLAAIYPGKVQLTDGESDTTVASVTVDTPGSSYETAPDISFTGGGGSGATAHATLTADAIATIVIDNPGTGYTSVPTVNISGGGGSGGAGTAVLGVAALPSGVATRLYMGDNTEFAQSPVELVITAAAIEEDDGVSSAKDVVITVPKVNLSPYKQGDLGNRAKETFEFSWTAVKTTTDIAGDDLPSVPADGTTWYVDVLA
jgi:hypothetical protein